MGRILQEAASSPGGQPSVKPQVVCRAWGAVRTAAPQPAREGHCDTASRNSMRGLQKYL